MPDIAAAEHLTPASCPARKSRPYIFLGQTTSLCETCLTLVPAKIVQEGEAVYYLKRCAEHGVQKTLISTEATLLEALPGFPEAGRCAAQVPHPHRPGLSLRLRALPRPRAAQLPGADRGQRALQPDLPDLLCQFLAGADRAAQPRRGRGHARSPGRERGPARPAADFRRRADPAPADPRHHPRRAAPADPPRDAEHQRHPHRQRPGFCRRARRDEARASRSICNSTRSPREALQTIRGADLRRVRERALDALERAGISTTLVCVIRKGRQRRRDRRCAAPCAATALRARRHLPAGAGCRPQRRLRSAANRIVLSEIRRAVIDQWGVFGDDDMIPLPCNPEAISIGYGMRAGARGDAADASVSAGGAGPDGAELGDLRGQARDAPAADRAAVVVLRRAAIGQRVARGAVLPAAGRGAGRRSATTGCSG